jgi:flavin reductase (DIM6/NTAB) family NADH-FMN oxidoreductase RutF
MVENPAGEVRRAMEAWRRGRYVLTSAFEQKRTGVFVESAQPCAMAPPLVCVVCRKGHPIGPIIRDSHRFGLCELDGVDKAMQRKFAFDGFERGDPFDIFDHEKLVTGAPVLRCAAICLDCEVYRHLDLECECELYIGLVRAARVNRTDA